MTLEDGTKREIASKMMVAASRHAFFYPGPVLPQPSGDQLFITLLAAAARLSGELNISALEQTLGEILRRHESLRTRFAVVDGEPAQVITPAAAVRLPLVDLSAMEKQGREAEARRLAGEEARRPFDLSAGPLFRVRLLRLSTTEHVLLSTMHHIVSDGWSLGVLIKEVTILYQAYAANMASPLPELAIQYADFAAWQRQWLSGEVLEKQLAYWKRQLQGAPAVLELPTDRPRPAARGYRGARQGFKLSESVSVRLKDLSREESATPFMILLAAFDVLLSRYTGQSDIVVGSPIANRNRAEIEPLIGFFVNTLALLLRKRADDLLWEPLVAIQPDGSKPQLFFVHPVGGNVLCYVILLAKVVAAEAGVGLEISPDDFHGFDTNQKFDHFLDMKFLADTRECATNQAFRPWLK